jgi:hypothetical protein
MTTLQINPADCWSQFDDEAIIVRCLERTGIRSETCCEFGAWDGMKFSNTAWLVRSQWWAGTFIEQNEERADRCRAWYSGFFKASVITSPVTIENVNQLVPDNLDFLSIDIDGNDLWVWEALESRPGLVCIEFNERAGNRPNDVDFIRQEWDVHFGATEQALRDLADVKGYVFLERDRGCNLFFGDSERLK